MSKRLEGKVAIVTGAANPENDIMGNGGAIASLFAREGAKVVLVNLSRDLSEVLQQSIQAEGGECFVIEADVTNETDVQKMVDTTMARYGQVDVLVNNVGISRPGTAETVTNEDWERVIRTNLTSTMLCSRYCLPSMKKSKRGSIINISTAAGVVGTKVVNSRIKTGFAAYSASKAAIHGLTRSTAADYAEYNIRSNGIIVGAVWTPMASQHGEEMREKRRQAIPLKTEGTAWDVAWAAVFLASEESRWITGTFLTVDGGFLSIREL